MEHTSTLANGIPSAREEDITTDHFKLLYLIWRYSYTATSKDEKDRWIRKIPLLVLIYEGIVANVFDYDYAPFSEVLGLKRVYLNISQEGRDDIDDLRELGLINGLKVSTKGYQSITAFQVSPKGLKVLQSVPQKIKDAVDSFVFAPGTKELLTVRWNDEKKAFFLVSTSGKYSRESTITDCEDVSYVSSPFLPTNLRARGSRPTASNAARAHLASTGTTNIRDQLSEVIVLSDVKILVGEWIPFGANQIVALNDKLGSAERVKGGLFTSLVDRAPDTTNFEAEPGLTSVQILDFELSTYLNFEAEVYYPEDEGIVQIEQFGVHCRDDGFVLCGLSIESVMEHGRQRISLDHLARLLVDIHQDSSQILDSVISSYQRQLLSMMFMGDSSSRDKFNIIIASKITPKMRADKYMDKEEHENELKQVLGDTQAAHDLDDEELLVIGRHGLLLVGRKVERHCPLLTTYLSLMGRSIFITNYYLRLFSLSETLKRVRSLISTYEKNPNSIPRIRAMLSDASQHAVQLSEILQFLHESLEDINIPPIPRNDPAAENLHMLLDIQSYHKHLQRRVKDLDKNVKSIQHELDALRESTDVISETQMFRVQEALQANTKNLEDVFRSGERQSNSLEILQVILSGTLAFELLDRVTGEWTVVDTPWAQSLIVEPLLKKPGVWFLVNLCLWGLIAYCLTRFMNYLSERSSGVAIVKVKANMPIDLKALAAYLASKPVGEEEADHHVSGVVKKASWTENQSLKWKGPPPKVELTYEHQHGFLLSVYLQVEKLPGKVIDETFYKNTIFQELRDANVIVANESPVLSAVDSDSTNSFDS